MILIGFAAKVIQIVPHLDCRLGHLCEICVFKVELVDSLLHFGVQQGIAAASLKFGEDPGAIHRCPFCTLHFDQEVDDTKWK